jgi:hypothetical protein
VNAGELHRDCSEWLEEIHRRYGRKEGASMMMLIEVAALVMQHGLTPGNVTGWIEGRIVDYEETLKELYTK